MARERLAGDERELVKRLPTDDDHDEKALLAKVRAMQNVNGGGDPMNGRREGLRCRNEWCDTLVNVPLQPTEGDVVIAIRARKTHESVCTASKAQHERERRTLEVRARAGDLVAKAALAELNAD